MTVRGIDIPLDAGRVWFSAEPVELPVPPPAPDDEEDVEENRAAEAKAYYERWLMIAGVLDKEGGGAAIVAVSHSESEAAFQAAVVEAAKLFNWRVHHTRPAQTGRGWRTPIQGHAGFPDLVLAHPRHGVLFLELKSEKGKLSPEQVEWVQVLSDAGAGVRVCRPSDWSALERLLRGYVD